MDIHRPTLLINRAVCERNIESMINRAQKSGVRLRPHFKTHQSAEVGDWFRAKGVAAITVSSISMARYFADHGWDDITIAFPVNLRELDDIKSLAGQVKLGLLVESEAAAEALVREINDPVDVWLEVSTGYHRTGIPWNNHNEANDIASIIQQRSDFHLRGLLTHAGHTYAARDRDTIRHIYRETLVRLLDLRSHLAVQGLDKLEVSVGDTPACSVIDDFSGIDEMRPGNFVYYDVMQTYIGSCPVEDIAVAVACPVVSKRVYDFQPQLTVYGGAVHLSKESVLDEQDRNMFGLVGFLNDSGWEVVNDGTYVKSLSQEHGVIHATQAVYDHVEIGDLLAILPVHSCLTVDILRHDAVIIQD
ncbi:MAG: alanine racemase [Chloroflexi bacterium]|nr:alanine racemase [Chloroflexota bacterium]